MPNSSPVISSFVAAQAVPFFGLHPDIAGVGKRPSLLISASCCGQLVPATPTRFHGVICETAGHSIGGRSLLYVLVTLFVTGLWVGREGFICVRLVPLLEGLLVILLGHERYLWPSVEQLVCK